jgi:Leucine-rich repeat (LRR) protein
MATKPRKATNSMRNTLQRERSQKRTITHATERAAILEATKTEQIRAREAAHTESRLQTEAALRGQRQSSARRSAAVGTVTNAVTPSGGGGANLVMVTIFTMAGLILVYQLVTRGPAVSGFLGGLGNWMHSLSSTTPLFTQAPKVG